MFKMGEAMAPKRQMAEVAAKVVKGAKLAKPVKSPGKKLGAMRARQTKQVRGE